MRIRLGLRLRPLFDVAIPGIYAWVVTVAVPVYQKDSPVWPWACAWVAFACLLLTSGLVVSSRLRAWSAISVTGFVMSSASVWFLLAPFEVAHGFLGALGWAAFAIGWVRAAETAELPVGTAAHRLDLLPRHRVHRASWATLAIGVVGALVVIALAWNIEGRERSLLGHAVAGFGALSLMTAAATHASVVGRQAVPRRLSKGQLGRALGLVALVVLGAWLSFFRS